jgi:sulfite exporter TauE/SafE
MTMNEPLTLFSALVLGLMGGVHCIGMCGGISSALGLTDASRHPQKLLAYNFGRIFSYTLMGSFAGLAAGLLQEQWQVFGRVMRLSANLLLILMGLYQNISARYFVREKARSVGLLYPVIPKIYSLLTRL